VQDGVMALREGRSGIMHLPVLTSILHN